MSHHLRHLCQVYHNGDSDRGLHSICQHWGYLSYGEVLRCLAYPHYQLIYSSAQGRENSTEWTGVLLVSSSSGITDICFIYIDPKYRRQGIARLLYQELYSTASRTLPHEIFLEVRASNLIAQKFYYSVGMVQVGSRRSYYSDGEDAFIFRADIK